MNYTSIKLLFKKFYWEESVIKKNQSWWALDHSVLLK